MPEHREHTILLSRERVNKGTKRMNSLPLSPVVVSFILRDFTRKPLLRDRSLFSGGGRATKLREKSAKNLWPSPTEVLNYLTLP